MIFGIVTVIEIKSAVKKEIRSMFALTERSSLNIDIIKIIASQVVLLGHINFQYNLIEPKNDIFPVQSLSVTVFFVISGFLTLYSYYNHKKYMASEYIKKRFVRIYPAYFLSFGVVLVSDLIILEKFNLDYMFRQFFSVPVATANLAFLQMLPVGKLSNYSLNGNVIGCFGSAVQWWTLSIEWWLYISFAVIAYRKRKKKKSAFDYILLAGALIIPVNNFVGGVVNSCIVSAWILGMGAVAIVESMDLEVSECFLAIIVFAVLGYIRIKKVYVPNVQEAYDPIFSMCITVIFALILLVSQKNSSKVKPLYKKCIHILAEVSYPLYLVHYSIMYLFFVFTCYNYFSVRQAKISTWLVSNILAYIIYRIDKKIKKFYFQRKCFM